MRQIPGYQSVGSGNLITEETHVQEEEIRTTGFSYMDYIVKTIYMYIYIVIFVWPWWAFNNDTGPILLSIYSFTHMNFHAKYTI